MLFAISQYVGENNKLMTNDLGLEWFEYVGSNIETTREFCEHLTEKRYIHKSEIKTILKGEIDGHQCEIYEKTGLPKGMIEGTNEQNFQVNCGGWNCRHQLVPVAKEAVPKNEKEALPYRNNPDYTDVKTNEQGGMKATHVGHIKHSATKEETFFDEKITSTELEKECQNILFKEGNSAILLQEGIKRANGTEAPALDIKLNGEKIDIRSITQECDTYRNALNAKNKQIKKFLKEYPTEKVESVCLYFHDPKMYSKEKVIEGYKQYVEFQNNNNRNAFIKKVVCIINKDKERIQTFIF